MSYRYLDEKRSEDANSLPDVEVWEDYVDELECSCGVYDIPGCVTDAVGAEECYCPSCAKPAISVERTKRNGWFFQYGMPGYLPDSSPWGPYETEDEALEEAREYAGIYDEEED